MHADYVYVNMNGTARELTPDETAYLSEKFEPFDSGRPYIKPTYEALDGWGSRSGFLPRAKVPSFIEVEPVNPAYAGPAPLTRDSMIAESEAIGDTVQRSEDGKTITIIPNPDLSIQERFEKLRQFQWQKQAAEERRSRHPDYLRDLS